MELKLRDGNEEVKVATKKTMDLETGDILNKGSFNEFENEPIKISTTIDYKSPSEKKSGIDVVTIIKWVVVAVIIVVAVKLIGNLINPKTTDLTPYINMETGEVASGLDLDLVPDEDMASKINHYSNGTVTVDGDGEVGVVYIDGKYAGLHTDSKSYTMFNLKIGDPEYSIEDDMSYEFDECMSVLNDMAGGNSTAYFYNDISAGDSFVVIINNHSNNVVALTYFSNYEQVTETLESLVE